LTTNVRASAAKPTRFPHPISDTHNCQRLLRLGPRACFIVPGKRVEVMRQPGQAALVVRRSLLASGPICIDSFAVDPASDACGDVERQDSNVVVLPFAGVFAKHEAPGRHVVGTPSHAVFIAADTPYRLAFPGAIGDRAIILRFDNALAPEAVDRRPGETLGSHGLLSAEAMMRRDQLRQLASDPSAERFEIETSGLEVLNLCLGALRQELRQNSSSRSATHVRRARAVQRVKEAVAVAPARGWNVGSLAKIANLSPFHLCHVFREATGVSIYDYVLRERLAQALKAVLDGGDITAIALEAGFASHSHFTARFKRFFGSTPSTLRQRMGVEQQLRKIMTARGHARA
jgi:AraC family transcriptional regulator